MRRNVEENYRYIATSTEVNYKYNYDSLNRVIEKNYYSDANGEYYEKNQYVYDKKGNIAEENFYRNNKLIYIGYYFYDEKNSLPVSELRKYPNNERFDITNFNYEFYKEQDR